MNTLVRAHILLAIFLGLTGCAETHWESAFYKGAQQTTQNCAIRSHPSDAPCAKLPDYTRYARERLELMSPKAATTSTEIREINSQMERR